MLCAPIVNTKPARACEECRRFTAVAGQAGPPQKAAIEHPHETRFCGLVSSTPPNKHEPHITYRTLHARFSLNYLPSLFSRLAPSHPFPTKRKTRSMQVWALSWAWVLDGCSRRVRYHRIPHPQENAVPGLIGGRPELESRHRQLATLFACPGELNAPRERFVESCIFAGLEGRTNVVHASKKHVPNYELENIKNIRCLCDLSLL